MLQLSFSLARNNWTVFSTVNKEVETHGKQVSNKRLKASTHGREKDTSSTTQRCGIHVTARNRWPHGTRNNRKNQTQSSVFDGQSGKPSSGDSIEEWGKSLTRDANDKLWNLEISLWSQKPRTWFVLTKYFLSFIGNYFPPSSNISKTR